MADDVLNRVDADKPNRPQAPGDVPEPIRRRYLTETRQGLSPEVAFYLDATAQTPSFRDRGRRLSTSRNDPKIARDLVAIASHRGWTAISVRGETSFRREVWRAAMAAGLEVRGYRPTERDRQSIARGNQDKGTPPTRPPDQRQGLDDRTRRKIVEAVVRERIVEPALQAKILAAVRSRLGTTPAPQRGRSSERNLTR